MTKLLVALLLLTGCQEYPPTPGFYDGGETDMALNYPPNGWQVAVGAWTTDIDESTTVLNGGIRSIHFKNTTPASDPVLEHTDEQVMEVRRSEDYRARFMVRADSVTATNHVVMKVEWLDSSLTQISVSTIYDAAVAAVNTWEEYTATVAAPATAAFSRVQLSKTKTAFNAYVQFAVVDPGRQTIDAYRTPTTQSIPTATGTTIIFNAANNQIGISHNTSTGVLTINQPGLYSVSMAIYAAYPSGTFYSTYVSINGGTSTLGPVDQGYSGGSTVTMKGTRAIELNEGDTLEVVTFQTSGSNQSVQPGFNTYLNVAKVE